MAIVALTDISAALSQLFAPVWTKAMNRHSLLATLVRKDQGRGKNLAWDVEFSGASAASYADGADASVYDSDTSVPATLDWARYRSSFSVSGTALAAARTSPGLASALLDLITSKAEGSASKLLATINADLYVGNAANKIVGLQQALAATGTYGNIAKATYTEWAGNKLANGAVLRPLTKALLDQAEKVVYEKSGLSPQIVVVSPGGAMKFEALFDPMAKNQIAPDLSPLRSIFGSDAVIPPVVTQNLVGYYKGKPVLRDIGCPVNEAFMLNLEEISLEVLPQVQSDTAVSQADVTLRGNDTDPMSGIAARIISLAKTGDADKYSLQIYPQLKVKRPGAHAWIVDIDET